MTCVCDGPTGALDVLPLPYSVFVYKGMNRDVRLFTVSDIYCWQTSMTSRYCRRPVVLSSLSTSPGEASCVTGSDQCLLHCCCATVATVDHFLFSMHCLPFPPFARRCLIGV